MFDRLNKFNRLISRKMSAALPINKNLITFKFLTKISPVNGSNTLITFLGRTYTLCLLMCGVE